MADAILNEVAPDLPDELCLDEIARLWVEPLPYGGWCRAGSLLAGSYVPVFYSCTCPPPFQS